MFPDTRKNFSRLNTYQQESQ